MSLQPESRDAQTRRTWFNVRAFCAVIAAATTIYVTTVVVGAWKASRTPPPASAQAEFPHTLPIYEKSTRHVMPDRIEWSVTVTARAKDRATAIRDMRAGANVTRAFLADHGGTAAEVYTYPMAIEDDIVSLAHHHSDGSEDTMDQSRGFIASQRVQLRSNDVARVMALYRDAVSDPTIGAFDLGEPACTTTQLTEIERSLVDEARTRLRSRAEAAARSLGTRLGKLEATTPESFISDTTPREPSVVCVQGMDALAIVQATYAIE